MDIIFETERLIVRRYTETDEENFYRLNSDPEIVRYIREPKNRADCKLFLQQNIAAYVVRPLIGRWAAIEKKSGIYIGSFAIIPVENTSDMQLGYALLKEHWGKGFAVEATLTGMQYAFNTLGLDIIYAMTEMPNIASQKVLRKAGFIQTQSRMSGNKELCCFYAKR